MDSASDDAIDWYPARLFRDSSGNGVATAALIVLNQALNDMATLKRIWQNTSLHVAADGGANRLYALRSQAGGPWIDDLHVIIGDLDSLRDDVRDYYVGMERPAEVIHDPDQYSTDFAKAVKYVRSARSNPGVVDVVALGGLGGRVDQGLSQLHHLYLFQKDPHYAEGRLYLVSGEGLTFLLKAGTHRIRVRERAEPDGRPHGEEDVFDKYVGILPIGASSVITTKGLEWDVTDWKTEFGGQMSTSNHVLPDTEIVEVQSTSDVLFTIALKRADGDRELD